MTRHPWIRLGLLAAALVPLLAACAETEEDRARRIALEAAQRRNTAAGAAIVLIAVAAYRLWRRPVAGRWPGRVAAGALLANEVVAGVLLSGVGLFLGLLLGPEPPPPSTSFDRGDSVLLLLIFMGPFAALAGAAAYWLRDAPRRFAADPRPAGRSLAWAQLPAIALFAAVGSESTAEAWVARAGLVAAVTTLALVLVDARARPARPA